MRSKFRRIPACVSSASLNREPMITSAAKAYTGHFAYLVKPYYPPRYAPWYKPEPWRSAAANGDLKWPFPHRPCFEQDDLSQSLLDVLTLWSGRSTKALLSVLSLLDRPPCWHPMARQMRLLDLSAEVPVFSPRIDFGVIRRGLMWGQDQLGEGKQ